MKYYSIKFERGLLRVKYEFEVISFAQQQQLHSECTRIRCITCPIVNKILGQQDASQKFVSNFNQIEANILTFIPPEIIIKQVFW